MTFGLKALSIFVSVLVLSSCQPKNNRAADKQIDNPFQKKSKQLPTYEELKKLDSADGLDFQTKNQCAIDVCGPLGPKEDLAKLSPEQEKVAWDKFILQLNQLGPLIDKAVTIDIRSSERLLLKLEDSKSVITTARLAPKQKAFINFMWAISQMKDASQAWEDYGFNDEKLNAALKSKMSAADILAVKKMMTHYLTSLEFNDGQIIDSMGFGNYIRSITKSDDLKVNRQASREYAAKLVQKLKVVKAEFPLINLKLKQGLLDLADGKDIDATSLETLGQDVGISYLYTILNEQLPMYTKRNVDLSEIARAFYTTVLPSYRKETAPEAVKKAKGEAIYKCGIVLQRIERLRLVEDKLVKSATDVIETARAHSLKAVETLSHDSAVVDLAKKKIMESRFSLPNGAEKRLRLIKKGFDENISGQETLEQLFKEGKLEDYAFYMAVGLYMRDSDDSNEYAEICTDENPDAVSDKTVTGLGLIGLSWPTIKDRAFGYGVLAHEFGHGISSVMKTLAVTSPGKDTSGYSDAKSCTASRTGERPASRATDEEDFADLFAARVVVAIEAEGLPTKNFGCLLLGRDENRYGTQSGLSLKPTVDDSDPHSPALFRMIQGELDRGNTLPSSCSKLVDSAIPMMRKTCLK